MGKIHNASVDLLNYKFTGRKIYCIGCGKRLFEILDLYRGEPFVKRIDGLFDNNSELWGIKKQIDSKYVEINNPVLLKEIKKAVLVITSDKYLEIYDSIKEYIDERQIIVYKYPHYYYWWTQTLLDILGRFPRKRQILFCAGNEPHDNADEIVTYLNETYKGRKYSVVYLGKYNDQVLKNVKQIESNTVRLRASFFNVINYCRLYAHSKYLCYENQTLEKVNKKQCLVYLNHGTIPLKNVNDVLRQSEDLDIGVCPGEGCSNLYTEQYGIPIEKQIFMMPARVNRMLRTKGKIHELLNVSDKKVILWLPTFRQLKGSERKDSYCINPIKILEENIIEINTYLEKINAVIALKKHPREKDELFIDNGIKNIYILRDEQLDSDSLYLQDILKDSDALITDYSGISFEYMLLDRPIGYVLSDINEYTRGFSVNNPEEYMPGEKIYTKDQLLLFLGNVANGTDSFANQRRILIKKLFGENAFLNGAEAFIKYLDRRDGLS